MADRAEAFAKGERNLHNPEKSRKKKRSSFTAERMIRAALQLAEKAIPEKVRGERDVFIKKLSVRYSGNQLSEAAQKYQRRNVCIYISVASAALLMTAAALLYSVTSGENIASIQRPEEGEGQKTVPVTVEAQADATRVKRSVSITMREESLTEEEKDRMLSVCAGRLPDLVAPKIDGKRLVTEDFSLPQSDGSGMISIAWESSDPVLISGDGMYDVLALAEEEEEVELRARLTLDGREREISFPVILRKDPSLYPASLLRKVEEVAEELSAGSEGDSVSLPREIGEDISLTWKAYDAGSAGMITVAGIIAALVAFSRRYSSAEREIRKYRQEIVRHFPSFIDKLVLLLNSGLTVISAMDKIASDYEKQAESERINPLAAEISVMGRRVREMNASVAKEWKDLSARTGINEIMRFSTIIEDNLHKGTVLAEKLEVEGNLLREREKKSVQEKMRMIDTKLTLPMILMLFSLVLVTVAPAMMQM